MKKEINKYYYDYKGENKIPILYFKSIIDNGIEKNKEYKEKISIDNIEKEMSREEREKLKEEFNKEFFFVWIIVSIYIMKMDISAFHLSLMKHRLSGNKTLTLTGRGLGKSYALTIGYSLTLILLDRDISVAIITSTHNFAVDIVKVLKSYFEEGGVIYELYGDLRGSEWKEQQFNLIRSQKKEGELEKTVTAVSIGAPGRIVGRHYDVLLLDDIEDSSTTLTKKNRDKTQNILDNDILNAVHNASVYQYQHLVGTHYHFDDMYSRIEDAGTHKTLKIKTVVKDKEGGLRCIWDGVSEERFESILDLKKRNFLAFSQQFQQEIVKKEGNMFKKEWFQYFDKYETVGDKTYVWVNTIGNEEGRKERIEVEIWAGVDLAISIKKSADYFVYSVIGIDKNHNIYLLDLNRGKYTFNEQINIINKMSQKWRNTKRIGIETVAYQQSLFQEVQRTLSLPVVRINTSKSKDTRLNIFSSKFETGQVFIYQSISQMNDLTDEFLDFPEAEHDDIPDSFCLAWETSQKGQSSSINRRELGI